MLSKYLTTLLGLTSVIVFNPVLSVKAEPVIYIETGGKESLSFDPDGLAILESIGLSLASVKDTNTPAPGYDQAFDILLKILSLRQINQVLFLKLQITRHSLGEGNLSFNKVEKTG